MRIRALTTATLFSTLFTLAALPARAAEQDPDPWLGRDKALHFGASAAIASGGYALGAALFDARGHALILGGSLGAVAGIGKEMLDLAGFGHPSFKDLAWDGLGTVTGLALAWAIDLLVRGSSDQQPPLVAPRTRALAFSLTF